MASSRNAATQRGAGREKVRAMQQAQARSQRRQRSLIITAAVVVAVLLVAVVVFALARARGEQVDSSRVVVPAGVSDTGGITKAADGSTGAVRVVEYLDYQCPACQAFDTAVGPYLAAQVAAGAVQVEYHPLNFLRERGSSTDYSLRSASAAYCLADDGQGDIAAFSDALYAQQAPEGGPGLPDATLVAAARDAGASDAVEGCITSGTHSGYVNAQTAAAGIQVTPTVVVAGEQVADISLAGITAAIEAAQR